MPRRRNFLFREIASNISKLLGVGSPWHPYNKTVDAPLCASASYALS
jgi:hypothetical protein